MLDLTVDLGNGNTVNQSYHIGTGHPAELARLTSSFDIAATDILPDPNQPGSDSGSSGSNKPGIPDLFTDKVKIHFGTGNDSAEDYYYINKHDATMKGLGLEGVTIQTQQSAQETIVKVNDAIVKKDKISAKFGAMQNRLEYRQQSDNPGREPAGIRIPHFRYRCCSGNDKLRQEPDPYQSAVAMLGQANSLPQMVMRLIGG